jgi:uncharacterized Tic20 family protein
MKTATARSRLPSVPAEKDAPTVRFADIHRWTFFMFAGVFIANLILCIIAGLEANKGNDYKYPFNYPFIK